MIYILAVLVLFGLAPIIYQRRHQEVDDEASKVVLQADSIQENTQPEAPPPPTVILPGSAAIASSPIGARSIAG